MKKLSRTALILLLVHFLLVAIFAACDENTIDTTATTERDIGSIIDTTDTVNTSVIETTNATPPETMSPDLKAKYPEITPEQYEELLNKMIERDSAYSSGIKSILFNYKENNHLQITFFPNQNSSKTFHISINNALADSLINSIFEITEDELITIKSEEDKLNGTITYYLLFEDSPSSPQNEAISQDRINALLKLIYDIEFNK
ncbi:MAG: hypothetical protein IKJ04_01380 [Clostridia bacterium]|nr:hypothetical protein [Clostridia bacterium]